MRNTLRSLALACGLLLARDMPPSPAQAQSNSELKALNDQVIELYRAGKTPMPYRCSDRRFQRTCSSGGKYRTSLVSVLVWTGR